MIDETGSTVLVSLVSGTNFTAFEHSSLNISPIDYQTTSAQTISRDPANGKQRSDSTSYDCCSSFRSVNRRFDKFFNHLSRRGGKNMVYPEKSSLFLVRRRERDGNCVPKYALRARRNVDFLKRKKQFENLEQSFIYASLLSEASAPRKVVSESTGERTTTR